MGRRRRLPTNNPFNNDFLSKFGKTVEQVIAEMQTRAIDAGNKGESEGWQNPSLDTSSWEKVNIPDGWFTDKNIYGSVWFRHDVEIPESMAQGSYPARG